MSSIHQAYVFSLNNLAESLNPNHTPWQRPKRAQDVHPTDKVSPCRDLCAGLPFALSLAADSGADGVCGCFSVYDLGLRVYAAPASAQHGFRCTASESIVRLLCQ